MLDKYSIESKFGTPIEIIDGRDNSKEYRYNCPFCIENRGDPDTKGHLFVNDKYGFYHCYRCGASGKIYYEDTKGYSKVELVDNSEILKSLVKIINNDSSEPLDMIIPRKKALDDRSARSYLNSRGLTDEMIDNYDIRVGSIFSNLLGYVIIPNQVKKLVMTDMYCARTFTGQSPKYRNPPSSRSGILVYNLHKIRDNPDRIIICEGVFDAMSAGPDAVSLYGKECSEIKLSKILSKKPKKVYINLDLDAKPQAYDLARRIYKRDPNIETRILLIDKEGYKDASDFLAAGRIDEYYEMLENTKIYNPVLEDLEGILGAKR